MEIVSNEVFNLVLKEYKKLIQLSWKQKLFYVLLQLYGVLLVILSFKRFLFCMIITLITLIVLLCRYHQLKQKQKKLKEELKDYTDDTFVQMFNFSIEISDFDNRISKLRTMLKERWVLSLENSLYSKPMLNYLIASCDSVISRPNWLQRLWTWGAPIGTFFLGKIIDKTWVETAWDTLKQQASIIIIVLFINHLWQNTRKDLRIFVDKPTAALLKQDLILIRDSMTNEKEERGNEQPPEQPADKEQSMEQSTDNKAKAEQKQHTDARSNPKQNTHRKRKKDRNHKGK